MKIIGIFILVLELLALALQIRSECKKHNLTIGAIRKRFILILNKFKNKPVEKIPKKFSLLSWRQKK